MARRRLALPAVLALLAAPGPATAASFELVATEPKAAAPARVLSISLDDLAPGPDGTVWQLETWVSEERGWERVLARYDRRSRATLQRPIAPPRQEQTRLGRFAVAPDGRSVYVGGPRRLLQRRSGRTGRLDAGWRLRGAPLPADAQERPSDVAVLPGGSLLAAIGGTVERFGADGRWRDTLLPAPAGAGAVRSLATSPQGGVAVLHGRRGGGTLLTVLDEDGGTVTAAAPLAVRGVSGVALVGDRAVVRHAVTSIRGALTLLDDAGAVVASTPARGRARVRFSAMAFSAAPGGRLLVVDDTDVRTYRLHP